MSSFDLPCNRQPLQRHITRDIVLSTPSFVDSSKPQGLSTPQATLPQINTSSNRDCSSLKLSEDLESYMQGQCVNSLLSARIPEEGWFIAAPGYPPYGNYVWLRDNAECAMALDQYASTLGENGYFDITAKAILRAFRYLESVEKGVDRLVGLKTKLNNPDFYDGRYHPHARITQNGDPIPGPWNDIQYDSTARTIIALAKHLQLTHDISLIEKCRTGLRVAVRYLFDAIWDSSGSHKSLTVCANEWEEKDEPHLRSPLFSSVLGLLYAASRECSDLEEFVCFKDLDFKEFENVTRSMLAEYFVRDGVLRMIKRFGEPSTGICTSSLWLLTSYDVFPTKSEPFEKTVDSLLQSKTLSVELRLNHGQDKNVLGMRRYEIENGVEHSPYVDQYWGGQAWVITTAQLAIALSMKGDVQSANDMFCLCLQARNADGKLPEQFDGTFLSKPKHDLWKEWSNVETPPLWLAWSHAEVLRAYVAIYRSN